MKEPNVLIIGDHWDNADNLAHGLTQAGMKAVAVSVEEPTKQELPNGAFDIVTIDVCDATTEIVSLSRALRTMFDGPILVMCYENDERFMLSLYEEGIAEYVVKPVSIPLCVAKVRAWMQIASRGTDPTQNMGHGFQIEPRRRTVRTPDGDYVRLSKLEYQLFEILHRNTGRILPTNLLVERIWGQFEEGDSRLKYLVMRLRRKIEPKPDTPTYIETVGYEGYRFRRTERNPPHLLGR